MSEQLTDIESLEAALLEVSAKYTISQMTTAALRKRWHELHSQADGVRRQTRRLPEMAAPLRITHFEEVTDEDIRQSDLRLEAAVSGSVPAHLRSMAPPEDLRRAEV